MTPRRRIFLSPPHVGPRERELLLDALDSNFVAPVGPMLDAFEAELASYTGFAGAVAVASGTAALHLALRCVGVGPGDTVIVPTLTFIASVTPILFQGATPVFVDSDPGSWLLDVDLVAETLARLAREGRPAKAVIAVDLYGQPCDIPALVRLCAAYGAHLVADTAEALGSLRDGVHAGKGARVCCLSFNGNKIITTSGGGAVLSDDRALLARVRNLAEQAREPMPHYEHLEIGYNYRMSNVLAALGRAQLERIEDRVAQRRMLFERYRGRLGVIEGISFMPEVPAARANRWLSVLMLDPLTGLEPEPLRRALERHDIETRPVWKPMHLQPVFRGAETVGAAVAETLFAQGLCLPSGPHVDIGCIETIASTIEDMIAGRTPADGPLAAVS